MERPAPPPASPLRLHLTVGIEPIEPPLAFEKAPYDRIFVPVTKADAAFAHPPHPFQKLRCVGRRWRYEGSKSLHA